MRKLLIILLLNKTQIKVNKIDIMKRFFILVIVLNIISLYSCSDEIKEIEKDYPNDITFNSEEGCQMEIPNFGYVIPESPYSLSAFRYGHVTFNVKKNSNGTHSGFALSNKNYRSYPWCTSKPFGTNPNELTLKEAVDTSIYSVYSGAYSNRLKNFAVVRVDGDEAYFTIDKPYIVEHILVANTTYNFLLLSYGSTYSSNLNDKTQVYEEEKNGKLALVRNPNIPDPSSQLYGVWNLPDVYNFGKGEPFVSIKGQEILAKIKAGKAAADAARAAGKTAAEVKADSSAAYKALAHGYVKLIAKGFLNNQQTGVSEYYIVVRPGVAPVPYDKWDVVQPEWARWDLAELGMVDKVIFYMESSDVDESGKMRTPPYFCLDGIRLK